MRNTVKIGENPKGSLHFIYDTMFGRGVLKLLTLPVMSKIVGAFMNSKLSIPMIKKFILKNNIDMSEFENVKYTSYNEFFTRKILPEKRQIASTSHEFISPCDSKLTVYKIDENSAFKIKGSMYTISDLLQNFELASSYIGGTLLIFRLSVNDYHRYCYIDDGYQEKNTYIKGVLHTVQPVALKRYNIYKENCREYTLLHTKHFGDIVQVEVGALLVGKIKNLHENYTFKKGEEKGYFEFGGSTICLIVPSNIIIDTEIWNNTNAGLETCVKYGERIGRKNENTNI